MRVLGIGNAIVDVICKVDEEFINQNNLTKGTMKLFFDQNEFKKIMTNLKIEKTISGGSVANSIVGLSQLGNQVGFIGKVSEDELGNKYEEGLKSESVKFFYSKKKEAIDTGTCLILVTPDSERTMCTFLGIAGKINDLQKKVWEYNPSLETHTVETHIYRLRKKLKETFNDDNFIKSSKSGYSI